MKIQTSQLVIPAKARNQEKVEKKEPFRINWEKIVLVRWQAWVPAFAGMTIGGGTCAYPTLNWAYLGKKHSFPSLT